MAARISSTTTAPSLPSQVVPPTPDKAAPNRLQPQVTQDTFDRPSGKGYDGSRPAPGTTNTQAWVPINAPVKGDPAHRNAATYNQVINQFAVGVNPRYTPRNGSTFCNIFAWDVTRAMGAEIPHWVNAAGKPVGVGKGRELDANSVNSWLHQHGKENGWRKVSAQEAQRLANEGHPAVASWRNPGGIGHIGVVRPGSINGNGPALAQAGARNFNKGHVYDSFPRNGTEFWVNDGGKATPGPKPTPTPTPTPGPKPTPTPTPAPKVPQMDLKRGMEGAGVKQLQTALVKLGHMTAAQMATGPGIFGPKTEAALKEFQAKHGVPSTGYYGPLSRAALEKALARQRPSPTPTPSTDPIGKVPKTGNAFIDRVAADAIKSQRQTGVPASVTLAQAILESGWGKSGLAQKANNFFGIKGEGPAGHVTMRTREVINGKTVYVNANFRKYHSPAESFADHGRFLRDNRRYHNAFNYTNNPIRFAQEIAKAGYATDPNYASMLGSIIKQYGLARFDKLGRS